MKEVKYKKLHITGLHIYKILEKANRVIANTSCGTEAQRGWLAKRMEGNLGCYGNIQDFVCSNNFMNI